MKLQQLLFLLPLLLIPIKAGAQNYSAGSYGSSGYSSMGGRSTGGSFNAGFSALNTQAQPMPYSQQGQNRQNNSGRNSGSTMEQLEQTLNAVDSKSAWARTPVKRTAQAAPTAPPRMAQLPAPRLGATADAMSGMFPGVSRQEMLRVFLEGGSPQTNTNIQGPGPAPGSSGNNSNVYWDYQRAENEATKARNYANTARYDKEQWNRKNAATQAEYAANNADYAARRAESAAYTGDAQARSYANLARQAANRARENANRARYNADTIR